MKKTLSALVFSLIASGVAPAYSATISRIESAPGQSQSDWEASDAYKAFVCPDGTLRGIGVDLNFTTDRGDDKQFVTCDEVPIRVSESSTATPTPEPTSEPRGLGGYAVIHPDGHVCGVIVGNAYFANNDRTMTSEYMGCPIGSAIIFQTKPSPTGNVAGWHGANVTYSNGVFTINSDSQVTTTISDGIATDSTGHMWDTGSGVTLRAASVSTPTLPVLSDTSTATSAPSSDSAPSTGTAPSSGGSETVTATAVMAFETTTAIMPVAIPAADTDLNTLDEIFPEEEIIDSVEAVVLANGFTRIEVSTGYSATAMRVVASKKGVKKKYTYRLTTNSNGERIFRASLNLRGYTLVLIKGSTELDRIVVS
jgi:hypothetical protein